MRKIDPLNSEDIKRSISNEENSSNNRENQPDGKTSNDVQFTEVKNASASGLGTMGRSDEKLSKDDGDPSKETY